MLVPVPLHSIKEVISPPIRDIENQSVTRVMLPGLKRNDSEKQIKTEYVH